MSVTFEYNELSSECAVRNSCPRWWRICVIALATLILCSCRMPPEQHAPSPHSRGTLPPHAYTGGPDDGYSFGPDASPATIAGGVPLPETIVTDWSPPGIQRPWPHDEYLHDGGDGQVGTVVTADGEAHGVELEDTIAHYDTIDGRTVVAPSNRVDIYSPRFGAVRRVVNAEVSHQFDGLTELEQPIKIVQHEEQRLATTAIQPLKPRGDVSIKQPIVQQQNQRRGVLAKQLQVASFAGGFLAHEDFQVIRLGIFDRAEKARLAERIDAAITWTHDKAVQIILDNVEAQVEIGDQKAQATFGVDVPNHPKLRVIKVASTNVARPGEIVDFTIRLDNVGDQAIGNVTLIDNLTTRLEYVPDSAQSSLAAEFSTLPNEGDSLVLRWEFTDPIEAGKGGLVRFHCKVR